MSVIYIHPPKCAGTSVVRSLRLRFLWKGMGLTAHSMRPLLDNSAPPLSYIEYEILANQAADTIAAHRITNGGRLVAGHFWYGKYLRLVDASVHRMTVVRDPVKRFLSHYRYLVWKFGLKQDLDEFLAGDRAKQLGSTYGFYFANQYPDQGAEENVIVDSAVETLRKFTLIGDVSDTTAFLKAVKSKIGGPLFSLRSNRTPSSVQPDIASKITDHQREQIAKITSVDRAIYDAVVRMPNYVSGKQSIEPLNPNRDESVAPSLT
jgi:hypothetical protein